MEAARAAPAGPCRHSASRSPLEQLKLEAAGAARYTRLPLHPECSSEVAGAAAERKLEAAGSSCNGTHDGPQVQLKSDATGAVRVRCCGSGQGCRLLVQLETGAARTARDGHSRNSAGWTLREQREQREMGAARDGGCWGSSRRALREQRDMDAAVRLDPARDGGCWRSA